MIRFILMLFYCAPRMTLAGVLIFTFILMGMGYARHEKHRMDQVMEEQRRRGFPTGLAEFKARAAELDANHPMVQAIKVDEEKFKKLLDEINQWQFTNEDEGLSEREKLFNAGYNGAERFRLTPEARKNEPHVKFYILKQSGEASDYQNLLRKYLDNAGNRQRIGNVDEALGQLEGAQWLCQFISMEINPGGSYMLFMDPDNKVAMDLRVQVCRAMNMLAAKWDNIKPEEKKRILGLIDELLDQKKMTQGLLWQCAVDYGSLTSTRLKGIYPTGSGKIKYFVNQPIDLNKSKRELKVVWPWIAREDRKRQEAMLFIQQAYSDLDHAREFGQIESRLDTHSNLGLIKAQDEANVKVFPGHLAFIRMTAINLACQLYRVDHGTFPEYLEELCPEYLKVVPANPFGGGWEYVKGENPMLIYRPAEQASEIIGGRFEMFRGSVGYTRMSEAKDGDIWREYSNGRN